ncbi:MAG: transposase [Granulosicoccus sp.]
MLSMITEFVDVMRLFYSRQFTFWNRLNIQECSSGSKHKNFGMINQGNRFLRTALI